MSTTDGRGSAMEGATAARIVQILANIAHTTRSLALQADRYDSELAAIRGEVAELRGLAEAATAAVRAAGLLHSVKA